jgi:hypothetical protein
MVTYDDLVQVLDSIPSPRTARRPPKPIATPARYGPNEVIFWYRQAPPPSPGIVGKPSPIKKTKPELLRQERKVWETQHATTPERGLAKPETPTGLPRRGWWDDDEHLFQPRRSLSPRNP